MDIDKTIQGGTFIDREMYRSKAYLSLNKSALIVLMALLDKRQFRKIKSSRNNRKEKICINLDSIELTYKELMKEKEDKNEEKREKVKEKKWNWGMTQQSASSGFAQLLQTGFIRVVKQGGTCTKDKSVYALIDDWKKWEPGTVFRNREPDVKRGYQGRGLGALNKNLRT